MVAIGGRSIEDEAIGIRVGARNLGDRLEQAASLVKVVLERKAGGVLDEDGDRHAPMVRSDRGRAAVDSAASGRYNGAVMQSECRCSEVLRSPGAALAP